MEEAQPPNLYLIRFVQVHERFRKPEIEALAKLLCIEFEFLEYSEDSPFAIIALPSDASAAALTSRAILAKGIYSLWGHGTTTASLHASVNQLTTHLWPQYRTSSFKFTLDCYQGKRSWSEGLELINSFKYVGFDGEIKMKDPDEEFCIFEEYEKYAPEPKRLFFGRLVGSGGRDAVGVYDLKKRVYISTTSMDAELALITANMAHAGPGKLFYDPFVGTGSMCIAASHFGAVAMGSDIDGRSFKGDMKKKSLVGNYREYGLGGRHLDCFISDLTNSPVLEATGRRWLDGIVCDPPYGVREGLKVLGSKEGRRSEEVLIGGVPSHYIEGYVAPKKPYSFEAMLDDVLEFAASTLVDDGRLSMWMPTANEEDVEIRIPQNRRLHIVSECIQPFNKWSRRLLTYRRLPDSEIPEGVEACREKIEVMGRNADDLNGFRRKYFEKAKPRGKPPEVDKEVINGHGSLEPESSLIDTVDKLHIAKNTT